MDLQLYGSDDYYPGVDGIGNPVQTCEACRARRAPLLLAPCPEGDGRHPLHRHVMCPVCWPEQKRYSLLIGKQGAIAWLN